MRRRFALIFNAKAGVALPRLLDGVLAKLRASGADVFQLPARSASEATEQVRNSVHRQECDAVIAAGGDGTFRAVASGAAGTSAPVGLIPLGTGNVLANEIGLRRRTEFVGDVLLGDAEVTMRGGLVNDAPFFLMTGAGFDARIVSRLNYRTKRALGRAAYAYPVLKTLAEGPQLFDVELDGRSYEASWVILSLVSRYGGPFVLTRDTAAGAGKMIAVMIEGRSRFGIAKSALALGLGNLGSEDVPSQGVRVLKVSRARIGRRIITPVQIDGDAAGSSSIEVGDQGPTVRVLVPRAYVADLTNRHTNRVPS